MTEKKLPEPGEDDLLEWVEIDGIKYRVQKEAADLIAALRQRDDEVDLILALARERAEKAEAENERLRELRMFEHRKRSEAEAEVERLRKDAERWRYQRSKARRTSDMEPPHWCIPETCGLGENIDVVIDKERTP